MKTKIMIAASMIAALAIASPMAYASYDEGKSHDGKWEEKREAKRQKLYQDLNLTNEQKQALEANKEKSQSERKASWESMKDKMKAMREELQKPELNMDKINQIQSELKAAQAQMLDAKLQGILEARKILTPEQFQTFMSKMDERKYHGKQEKEGAEEEKQ